MKKYLGWAILIALMLIMPAVALAGDACSEGIHDLDMIDFHYPTCKEDGYYLLECRNCNYTKKEINGKATGCDYEDTGKVDPTCTKPGKQSYECQNCGDTYTINYDPLGHDWKDMGTVYPDCMDAGMERMKCARCGEIWESVIPTLDHDWQDSHVLEDATCTKEGSMRTVCSMCHLSGLRVIEATGHSWKNTRIIKEATCTAEGKAESVCRTCGKESTRTLKKTAHSYGEWTITRQATETEKGSRTAVCQACGKKTTEQFDFIPGDIAVYTRTGKVNLRSGPAKGNKLVEQVEKKGTYVGQLREAAADQNGDVWFKVKYGGKICWIMARYAVTEVETKDYSKERIPEKIGTELTDYLNKSYGRVVEALELEAVDYHEPIDCEWMNEAVYMSSECNHYIEQIALFGDGFSMYGVKVGDRIKDAQKMLAKKNLVLQEEQDDGFIYSIPALPDALCVNEAGFCGCFEVIAGSDGRVKMLRLTTNDIEYYFTEY